MKSKILKEIIDNATPEVIARVNQISNDLRKENKTIKSDNTQTLVNALDRIKELESENEEMKAMLERVMANLTFNEQRLYNEIKELLNKK